MTVYANYKKHVANYKIADVCDDLSWNEDLNHDYSENPVEGIIEVYKTDSDPMINVLASKTYIAEALASEVANLIKVSFNSDHAVFEFNKEDKNSIKRLKTLLKQKTWPEIIKKATFASTTFFEEQEPVEWSGNEYKAGIMIKRNSYISLDPTLYTLL